MLLIRTYFEETHVRAQIVINDSIGPNTENVVYSAPISIYQGVNNPIKLFCLNSDQQYLNLSNANVTVQLSVFEPGSENELITTTASNFDNANGLLITYLTPSQLAPLDFGFYEIALTAVDDTGNVFPVYINDNYGNRLPVTLLNGPVMAYGNPIPLVFTDVSGVGVVSQNINLTQRPMGSSTATMEANLTMYTGNIIAQGSMVTTPFPVDWGNISATYYANISNSVFQTVSGSFAQLRFVVDGIDPYGYGNVNTANIALIISGGNIRI
jgi:hypothetical protein